MRIRHAVGSFPMIAMLALAACSGGNVGDKCKESCTQVCEGEDDPTAAEITNCENDCDELQARAQKRACDDELDDLFDCSAENACKATFAADCRDPSEAVEACNLAYCRSHTSDPDC